MKSVLVTGASGFIGRHVIKRLLERGIEVHALVRNPDHMDQSCRNNVNIVAVDFSDPEPEPVIPKDCDAVIHLAAKTHALRKSELFGVNVEGTRGLVNSCLKLESPPVFVFVSSLAAAGPSPAETPRTGNEVEAPVSNYGRSKLAAEKVVAANAARIPATIVRPATVFGPDDAGTRALIRPVTRLRVVTYPGSRHHLTSMIHVDDAVEAILKAAVCGERLPATPTDSGPDSTAGTGIYYLADRSPLSYEEFFEMLVELSGVQPWMRLTLSNFHVRNGGFISEVLTQLTRRPHVFAMDKARELLKAHWICDPAKLFRQLNFEPAEPLRTRWQQTLDWYRQEGFFRGPWTSGGRAARSLR